MKKSICIISFSAISRDARVLRQIKYLAPHYHLAVIGYGNPPLEWQNVPNIQWMSIVPLDNKLLAKLVGLAALALGKLMPILYRYWYWRKPEHADALQKAISSGCDAFHANDWEALFIAVEAARRQGGAVVFDAHEYGPLEFESVWFWRLLHSSAIRYLLHQYISNVDISITVAPSLAQRYKQEFQLEPMVVLNTPDYIEVPARPVNPDNIKLVHHGVANRDRHLEAMIEALALSDTRFELHFMLVENDPQYVYSLQQLAWRLAPKRVTFHPPIAPQEIVPQISRYDIGFCLLPPTTYNLKVSLPNKFFDFIVAGLAVCVGPSPEMANFTRQYKIGCVAPGFEPADVAKTLNELTAGQIAEMRQAALNVAKQFNAGQEMKKVVDIYQQLFAGDTA